MLDSCIVSLGDDYQDLVSLHESTHKGTMVFRGKYKQTPCIVKICALSTSSAALIDLRKEHQWYQLLDGQAHVPRLLNWTDGVLTIEDVGSYTIWQNADSNLVRDHHTIFTIADAVHSFHQPNEADAPGSTWELVRACLSRLKDLFLSGPKGTKKLGLYSRVRNRLLFVLFGCMLVPTLYIALNSVLQPMVLWSRRYHGDLHMNNFVISASGDAYLIDFECASHSVNGLLPDLLYVLTTFSLAGGDDKLLVNELKNRFCYGAMSSRIFQALKYVFLFAGSMNPRFIKKI